MFARHTYGWRPRILGVRDAADDICYVVWDEGIVVIDDGVIVVWC
jgi:hypothetical protein